MSCAGEPGLRMAVTRRLIFMLVTFASTFFVSVPTYAQTPPSFSENFQSFVPGSRPSGWTDLALSPPPRVSAGSFAVWSDPFDSSNFVYGVRQGGGESSEAFPEMGIVSIRQDLELPSKGHVEFRGRMFRASDESRVGVVLLSALPADDRQYLLGLWQSKTGGGARMQLFAGHAPLSGVTESPAVISASRWYRFAVTVDSVDEANLVRARFWPDGTEEPQTWSINALDVRADRPRGGTVGLWAARVSRTRTVQPDPGQQLPDALFDDIELTVAPDAAEFPPDTFPPTIEFFESGQPLPQDAQFNRDVRVEIRISDQSAFTSSVKLDGMDYSSLTPVTIEGVHTIVVEAVDAAGNGATAELRFSISRTGGTGDPVLSITSHSDGQLVPALLVKIAGSISNMQSVTVNGIEAQLGPASTTFSALVPLNEGANVVTAVGRSGSGRNITAAINLTADSRAPQLLLSSPPVGACTNAGSIAITGTVADPHLERVELHNGAISIPVSIEKATGQWSASLTGVPDGKLQLAVDAFDSVGHRATVIRQVVVDRTQPVVEVTRGGLPFTATLVNQAVSLLVRAIDLDSSVSVVATLDGAPFVAGVSIAGEGTHKLNFAAVDCAGNRTERTLTFEIDTTAPVLRNISPADGSSVGTLPSSIGGSTDADASEIALIPTGLKTTPVNGSFTLSGIPFAEGLNRFSLVVTDRAGNSARTEYRITVNTKAPGVEIVADGSPIVPGTFFNHPIAPTVRTDADATVSAKINGGPFTPGSQISSDGDYALTADAADPQGHVAHAQTTFVIDRAAPVVKIISPVAGTIQTAFVEIRGTSTESASVTVNGIRVPVASGSFVLPSLALDYGENVITVSARDSAGNVGSDQIVVSRELPSAGIVLSWPPEGLLTNRTSVRVSGRFLTPDHAGTVRINASNVAVDSAGDFLLDALPIVEGENTITVSAGDGAGGAQVLVHVRGDFTPPSLEILESGQPLSEGARFPAQAVISVRMADSTAVTESLTIDGASESSPTTVSASGGHLAIAAATDAAGNQSRVERTFSIGAASVASICDLRDFDPADHSVVTASSVLLRGQSGGAAGVTVNGARAITVGDSFLATVELASEGNSVISIACVDGSGVAVGSPVTLTLVRVTGNPSIAITTPAEGTVTAEGSVTASGTVSADVTSADVNGIAATISGGTFSAANVPLADGPNILVARGHNAANRVAQSSRRVTRMGGPPILAITSPPDGFSTGAATLRVSGTWSRLLPDTIVVNNLTTASSAAASIERRDDSSGIFRGDVTLAAGPNAIRISGRNQLGTATSTTITVTRNIGDPFIAINQPLDNAVFGTAAGGGIAVGGTFEAAPGSTVEVNGTNAAVSGNSFTATVPFSLSGKTEIVARVTQPDGRAALDIVRIRKLTDAPRVLQSFPANGASGVDPGVIVRLSFSSPMSGAATSGAFLLESSSGVPVTGNLVVDDDALTFSPGALLIPGERYTVRLSTAAADIGGNQLPAAFVASFAVATTAPVEPPRLDPILSSGCSGNVGITGSASPGARVHLQSATLVMEGDADSTGHFAFTLPLSGQAGVSVVRVRVVGADGSLSSAAEASFQTDCSGLRVLDARFDRTANKLTVTFSKAVDFATISIGATGSIRIQLTDGTFVDGSAASQTPSSVVITPLQDLAATTFTLSVDISVKDAGGDALLTSFSQVFAAGGGEPLPGDGSGFIAGEVFDATTGRPLGGANVVVEVPVNAFGRPGISEGAAGKGPSTQSTTRPSGSDGRRVQGSGNVLTAHSSSEVAAVSTATDSRGRYTLRVPEGAHTIEVTAPGHTSVWRQIIVTAGQGVVPIDIRLESRAGAQRSDGSAIDLTDGGTDVVRTAVALHLPAGSVPAGDSVRLTSLGAQSLPGLLPLGWSPLATAEIVVESPSSHFLSNAALQSAGLTFTLPTSGLAGRAMTAVKYEPERDEWIVLAAAVNVSGSSATVNIQTSGSYALVYPDLPPSVSPPSPRTNAPLQGVNDLCAALEGGCVLTSQSFTLDPAVIVPTGRTIATIKIDTTKLPAPQFPSGTAVQAYIDEELRLADGSTLLDPPFATDLLIYRSLDGEAGIAQFYLAPSAKASQVILEIGFDHIRVGPYPGRIDRGTLVGPEGGKVQGDGDVALEIPAGATNVALHASAQSLSSQDLQSFGSITGFRIVAGFNVTLTAAGTTQDSIAEAELFKPARAVMTSQGDTSGGGWILVEVLSDTPYGRVFRMAAQVAPLEAPPSPLASRLSTVPIDREVLPLDGIVRQGQYLLLAAENPIAYATGAVRFREDGLFLPNAIVAGGSPPPAPPLGVSDVTRASGLFVVPVMARPAAPFALKPSHFTTGTGALYLASIAPDADSVVHLGDLPITPQPPSITSTSPADGAVNVALTTPIRINFAPGIDAQSMTAGLCPSLESSLASACPVSVTDTAGNVIRGIIAADSSGISWTLPSGDRLKPNGRYTVTVSAAIRGSNGTPLGKTYVVTFATITQFVDPTVNGAKIHITLPVNGVSRIYGDAGAITSGWQAVAVRRGVDLLNRYQATASGDGSFSFDAGCALCHDAISTTDRLDLEIVNAAGNVAAVIPLTPFVTADGQGFLASPEVGADFTSKDGITVHVPAGAFDDVVIIHVSPASKDPFAGIPNLDADLDFITAVNVDIRCASQLVGNCVARKRLDVDLPVPAGLSTANRGFLLGSLGQSVRGPRLMIVDMLRLNGSRFTTGPASGTAQATSLGVRNASARTVVTGAEVKTYLLGLERSGIFAVVDLHVPVGASPGWILVDGVNPEYDLFWDTYESLYASHSYFLERGRVAIPIVSGKPFTLVGFDASTGLQAFSKAYDAIAISDPGSGVTVDSPIVNAAGPYPVFGTPFRIESVELKGEGVTDTSIRGMSVTLQGGIARVGVPVATDLPKDATITVLDPTRGTIDRTRDAAADEYVLAAAAGDQLIVAAPRSDVDPATQLSLVFSESISSGSDSSDPAVDSFLHSLFTLEEDANPPDPVPLSYVPNFREVAGVHYRLDSNARRLLIDLRSSLTRGAIYRLLLSPNIADRDGMRIGRSRSGGTTTLPLTEPIDLRFQVRNPGGAIGSFQITSGQIRDLSLNGNLLFVTALTGGLFAYDVSNPAAPVLAASIPAGVTDNWAVASDQHNRLYTTGLTPEFGVLRSYRIESLLGEGGAPSIEPTSSAIVSWAPGGGSGLALASDTVLSDRPEAIPRKLQLLVQDDQGEILDLATFRTSVSIASDEPLSGGFERFKVNVPLDPANPYRMQRITVENVTLDMRWSGDAVGDSSSSTPATIAGIVARPGDQLRVIRNRTTYGVISQFGFGFGVYDLNAIDSNDDPSRPPDYRPAAEQVRISSAAQSQACPPFDAASPAGAITDLAFSPEAAIDTDGSSTRLKIFGADARKGVLDIRIDPGHTGPPDAVGGTSDCIERAPFGLVFADSPRLQDLSAVFKAKTGRVPNVRFTGVSSYHWRLEAKDNRALVPATGSGTAPGARGSRAGELVERSYVLVPANEFGLLVVESGGTPPASSGWLTSDSLADVIWIPNGAASVRAIPRSNLAVVVDGLGYVLLVDLGRIDERWTSTGELFDTGHLFPTATEAINAGSGAGALDPRVVWRSAMPLASGTLAPVIDPDTGIVFTPELLGKKIDVVAAADPHVRMMTNLGSPGGLSEVSGIIPLGIAPPPSVTLTGPDASLAAFRLELTLPGAVVDALTASGHEIELAVESERVAGAATEQTIAPMPRSQLRRTRNDGSDDPRPATTFTLQRAVPSDPVLRRQRGYNKFVSPWIVAIADPRASEQYKWSDDTTLQEKATLGCEACNRPVSLAGKTEADGVFELYTNGRIVAVRPECVAAAPSSSSTSASSHSLVAGSSCSTIFAGTPYAYLGDANRLVNRFATVMADTVRPTDVLVAGQNPPVAEGMIAETVYLHSGELESSTVDLDAGGRAGWNVLFDRTYRSRTLGSSFLGAGWDSSIFRRLRPLPNGDVEYRDAQGEVWRFESTEGGYVSPMGLFLTLSRSDHGWILVDQKWRTTTFDELGRITAESDQFVIATNPFATGNVIRYLYDPQGRLGQIIDPVGRVSTIDYWPDGDSGTAGAFPGAIRTITDWRERELSYEYSPEGRLTKTLLVDVANSDGVRPAIQYGYNGASTNFNDVVEIAANLEKITDPSGPANRLTFNYETSAALRDRLKTEEWGTGETVNVEYLSPTKVATTDALGQRREVDLTAQPQDYTSDRSHARSLVEKGVIASSTPLGTLPAAVVPGAPVTSETDRIFNFSYQPQGLVSESVLVGVRKRTNTFATPAGAPGVIPEATTTTAVSGSAPPITGKSVYRTEANLTTFLSAVQANGIEIQSPEAGRSGESVAPVVSTNDSVTSTTLLGADGQPTELQSSGGTDTAGAGSNMHIVYFPDTASAWERGLPELVDNGGLRTSFEYPNRDTIVTTDPRGVVTRTEIDSWRRPRHVLITSPFELGVDERYQYDATGRLKQTTRQQGAMLVTTSYAYDLMNRQTSVRTDNVAVGIGLASVETSTAYDIPGHMITSTLPGGALVTTELDSLGRVVHRLTATGSSPIEERFAYDLDDNLVYSTDMKVATAAAVDVHGREVATMEPDGTKTLRTFDAWSRPTVVERLDSAGRPVAHVEMDFTPAGRMLEMRRNIDSSLLSRSRLAWDGAGRTTGLSRGAFFTPAKGSSGLHPSSIDSLPRATHARFDQAGRLLAVETGTGTATGISDRFAGLAVNGFSGMLPTAAQRFERGGSTYELSSQYDTLGDTVNTQVGPLQFEQHFDQAGNLTATKEPDRPAANFEYDGRGSMRSEAMPDGAANTFQYDASAALRQYLDPVSEATKTETDLLGRPQVRTYADGTRETIEWDGPRVAAVTDRQGRRQAYVYNGKGQIVRIEAAGGTLTDLLDYDEAGRLMRWTNKDAAVEYSEFDLAGHPRRTTQTRYRDSSGVGEKTVLDSYTQQHTWNEHDERTSTTMPAYAGLAPTGGWTTSLVFRYDAMGNLVAIDRQLVGTDAATSMLSAEFRNAGRPDRRTLTTSCGSLAGCSSSQIVRTYGYDAASSQLNRMTVSSNGREIAGSSIEYDGLQISTEHLLAVSAGTRVNQYDYDARSRLASSAIARDTTLPASEILTPADFRRSSDRTGHFDEPTRAALSSAGVNVTAIDPPSLALEEQPGHKIKSISEGATRPVEWTGAERTSDGRFRYTFDEKGRLIAAEEILRTPPQPILLREKFYYDGNNRLVGRRAEQAILVGGAAPKDSDWTLAGQELLSDGLPAEVTFVWDPIDDQLVAAFKAGASADPLVDGNGGLLRQVIHGGLQYDDPLEVTVLDPAQITPVVTHLYPIFDEAGAGTLQVIAGASGMVVSRHVLSDPYGGQESSLAGAAVDRVELRATKDSAGNLASVEVRVRLTDEVSAASIVNGVRLAAVDSTGAVVRSTTATPQLFDNYTPGWTLTASQWNTLVAGASSLSIAATNTLRSETYGATVPILPAPDWARVTRPVYSTNALPVEVREQLSTLASWLASLPNSAITTNTLYEVTDLALLGTPGASNTSRLLVTSPFQAQPYSDPITGLSYVRERWLDLGTGTWLTPDPIGYRDSSNLYAFAGGDPVNGRDPLGLCGEPGKSPCGFWGNAWSGATETVRKQADLAVRGYDYLKDFATDEGRQRNAQLTFGAGLRFSQCTQDPKCASALANPYLGDVERYLNASPEERRAMLGRDTGKVFVIGAETYAVGRLASFVAESAAAESLPAGSRSVGYAPQSSSGAIAAALTDGRSVAGQELKQLNLRAVPATLTEGRFIEAQQLKQLNLNKNTEVWRPSEEDVNSAAFRVIVGEPRYTQRRRLRGTIFDSATGGLTEIKAGSSELTSSYQLRLQMFRALQTGDVYTLRTSRPVAPDFSEWLARWGARVEPLRP